jgi:hypothetical protein
MPIFSRHHRRRWKREPMKEQLCGSSGARSHRRGRNIHNDGRSCQVLRLEVDYLMVLQEFPACDPLDHHHNLWGISTTVKSCHKNADNLCQHESKEREWLLQDIELDNVPLILRISCSISNAWSQSDMEKVVKSVQLWKKVLDLGSMGH